MNKINYEFMEFFAKALVEAIGVVDPSLRISTATYANIWIDVFESGVVRKVATIRVGLSIGVHRFGNPEHTDYQKTYEFDITNPSWNPDAIIKNMIEFIMEFRNGRK